SQLVCLTFFSISKPTTQIYSLSLHDALPISMLTAIRATLTSTGIEDPVQRLAADSGCWSIANVSAIPEAPELLIPPARHGRHGKDRKSTRLNSSLAYLVCRLLLEKKQIESPD